MIVFNEFALLADAFLESDELSILTRLPTAGRATPLAAASSRRRKRRGGDARRSPPLYGVAATKTERDAADVTGSRLPLQ